MKPSRITHHASRITHHASRTTHHASRITDYLALLILCSLALTPLLRADSPCTHDGALHYYRVAAMRHALLHDGILFTRFLPDLAFGYGYPFFNYREPLSYYLTLALHLVGFPLPVALNLVYALSIVGCALGCYLLARDLFGPEGALIAAAAYAYAPYQFLNALLRANAPESLALPLLPFILWAFRRLALCGGRKYFLLSVLSLAALYLTHNISSLLFTPFLIAYMAVLWLVYRREGRWPAVLGALLLAIGLTIWFVGPALLEQDYAQLHMSRVTRNNDFHYNFLTLGEIFAPPAAVNVALMNPPMRIHLGLAQAILGALGLVIGLIRWRGERRLTLIFLAVATVAMLWMATPSSLWVWEHAPLLPFIQFPWRLVGRAILPVSLMAAAWLPPHASRLTHYVLRITYSVTLPLLILAAFPALYPPRGYCPNPPRPGITDVFAYEHSSQLVGVDPEGSYFPVWVRQRPVGSPLEAQYAAGEKIARFDEAALPPGAAILEADYGPNRARLVVETPAAFTARYLAFYFPGWRVTIDDAPAAITPTDPGGLIAFEIPAGRHTVALRFGETPLRLACDAISILSLLILLGIRERRAESREQVCPPTSYFLLPTPYSLLICLLLLTFKLAVVDRQATIFRRPSEPRIAQPLGRDFADGMRLLGVEMETAAVPADGELRVDLYWTASARPTARYQSVIHLVGPDGLRWSLPDTARPRGYADYPPTDTWTPGLYALDSHAVIPLPGAPPGVYDLVLTLFDRDTLAPLSVLNEQGQPAAPTLTLGQATLTRPRRPAAPESLGVRARLDAPLGSLTLLGADFDRAEAAPGDSVLLVTFWRADQAPGADFTLHLTLTAPNGAPAAQFDLPPVAPWHPTSAWQPGDVWRGQHLLRLPAALADGDYSWQLSLLPTYSPLPATLLPTLHITAPSHTFTPPPSDIALHTPLGDIATLVGVSLPPTPHSLLPGEAFTITLIWRAERTPAESYHVFLHLLAPDGRLLAQSDGVPAGWTRPTTGWLPGEYIVDVHTLTLPPDAPPGEYILRAGLYLPGGERLRTPDGADAIFLTTVEVQSE